MSAIPPSQVTRAAHPLRSLSRPLAHRNGGTWLVLLLCLGVALGGALTLDRMGHPGTVRAQESVPIALTPVNDWLPPAMPPGTVAPDFCLPRLGDGKQVRLSDVCEDRPVVLLFGNLTSGDFRARLDRLAALARRYEGEADFLLVHIGECQESVSVSGSLGGTNFVTERQRIVGQLAEEHALPFPCLLDAPDRRVERAYAASPQRLVIVGVDGQVVLDAGPGGRAGWDLARVEQLLRQTISSQGPGGALTGPLH